MALLVLLLLAFYPLRPAKGAVMILLMLCYAVHRYINESLPQRHRSRWFPGRGR